MFNFSLRPPNSTAPNTAAAATQGHGQLTARAVSNALETLGQSENFDPKTRAELRGAGRLLMRILPFLQVGDRTQQKTEALRATLQELSDNLLRAEKEAPDLQVNITSFDKNLLPQDTGTTTARCPWAT